MPKFLHFLCTLKKPAQNLLIFELKLKKQNEWIFINHRFASVTKIEKDYQYYLLFFTYHEVILLHRTIT